MPENDKTTNPLLNSELIEKEAAVEPAPAAVEEASASTNESSSEVNPFENLISGLEDKLKNNEGVKSLVDKLAGSLSGNVAENVTSSKKGISAQEYKGYQEDLYEDQSSVKNKKMNPVKGRRKIP